ncbi:ASCH domain-containing protein [Serinicoccus hydrothermalis]|nr:ASCH domain-containing protein [Serinicoccus hydrothermalis]
MSEQTPGGPERSRHDRAIAAFWEDARIRGKLNRIEVYAGAQVSDTLPPPAWSFGGEDDPQTADRLLGLVLAGRKTATASAYRDYEADARARQALDEAPAEGDTLTRTGVDLDLALPEPGLLSILLDGSGHPRALIRITDVEVCRFADVTAEHARLEGEGNGTLADWRAIHRTAFAATAPDDEPVGDDTLVVLERFEVLVPASARRAARAYR